MKKTDKENTEEVPYWVTQRPEFDKAMKKLTHEGTEGIFAQIRKQPVCDGKPLTKKQLREMFDTMEREHRKFVERYGEMEKAHTKHFLDRAKELGEEPPLWLMMITSPSYNRMNGGHFFTSREFLEKHSKWLKDYNK